MLRTRTPRGPGVHRFGFDPLTGGEIEALQSVPSRAADHLAQCSCNNNRARSVLAEIVDLLLVTLGHGHQLAIEPHATDCALEIDIGSSARGAEGALDEEGIAALESSPYSAADKHRGACEVCRCAAPLPIEAVLTVAAIGLNHGHQVQFQPAAEGPEVTGTIASERHEAFDRPSGPVRQPSAIRIAMQAR